MGYAVVFNEQHVISTDTVLCTLFGASSVDEIVDRVMKNEDGEFDSFFNGKEDKS